LLCSHRAGPGTGTGPQYRGGRKPVEGVCNRNRIAGKKKNFPADGLKTALGRGYDRSRISSPGRRSRARVYVTGMRFLHNASPKPRGPERSGRSPALMLKRPASLFLGRRSTNVGLFQILGLHPGAGIGGRGGPGDAGSFGRLESLSTRSERTGTSVSQMAVRRGKADLADNLETQFHVPGVLVTRGHSFD